MKYYSKEDAQHLLGTLWKHYKVSTDWHAKNYCALTIVWNKNKGFIDVLIPEYVENALRKFCQRKPKRIQYSPHKWKAPTDRKRIQVVNDPQDSTLLEKKGKWFLQSIVGTFLY